jgi:hypothetical protein
LVFNIILTGLESIMLRNLSSLIILITIHPLRMILIEGRSAETKEVFGVINTSQFLLIAIMRTSSLVILVKFFPLEFFNKWSNHIMQCMNLMQFDVFN